MIDIDQLSEDELIDLNHRVVARLKLLSTMRSQSSMVNFRIGELVSFQPDGRPTLIATVVRHNIKSVSVVTTDGQKWTVSPHLLSKVTPASAEDNKPKQIHHQKHSRK
jgi:hypothetical protein